MDENVFREDIDSTFEQPTFNEPILHTDHLIQLSTKILKYTYRPITVYYFVIKIFQTNVLKWYERKIVLSQRITSESECIE